MNRTFLLAMTLAGLLLAALAESQGWFQRSRPAAQTVTSRAPEADLAAATNASSPLTNGTSADPKSPSSPQRPVEEVVGIGAALAWNKENRCPEIRNVIRLSPAAMGGLTPGWLISKIDGTPTSDLNLKECVDRLRGAVGSKVQIELIHPEESATNTVELIRQHVRL